MLVSNGGIDTLRSTRAFSQSQRGILTDDERLTPQHKSLLASYREYNKTAVDSDNYEIIVMFYLTLTLAFPHGVSHLLLVHCTKQR